MNAERRSDLITGQQYAQKISETISLYRDHGFDARVVGSLGRFLSINQTPTTVYSMYGIRDLDIVVMGPYAENELSSVTREAKPIAAPIMIDVQLHNSLTIQNDGSAYITRPGIKLEVDKRVFDLQMGNIYDVKLPTFLPETNFHLYAVYGHLRPKDLHNALAFGRELRKVPNTLPESMYAPFHQLYKERKATNPLAGNLMGKSVWYYDTFVPVSLRAQLRPLTGYIWYLYRKYFV